MLPSSNNNPFKTQSENSYGSAHAKSDVDTDRNAQHHTLGTSPVQAAPGNHKHANDYVAKDLIINTADFRVNSFTGIFQLIKQGRLVVCSFTLDTPPAGTVGGAAMLAMTVGWKPLYVNTPIIGVAAYDGATGNYIPCYLQNQFLVVAVARAAGTATYGTVTYMSDS